MRCAAAADGLMVPVMMDKPPAKRALKALDQLPSVEPVAPRRISKKVRIAIDAMVSGECEKLTEAAEKAGLARETLSRALSTPHVADYLRQQTNRRLAIAAARAGHTKVELLDSNNEMVRDRASSFVLGLAGIVPASESTRPGNHQLPGLQNELRVGPHGNLSARARCRDGGCAAGLRRERHYFSPSTLPVE